MIILTSFRGEKFAFVTLKFELWTNAIIIIHSSAKIDNSTFIISFFLNKSDFLSSYEEKNLFYEDNCVSHYDRSNDGQHTLRKKRRTTYNLIMGMCMKFMEIT